MTQTRMIERETAEEASSFVASMRARVARAQRYALAKLRWNRLFRATSYARSALWIVPLVAIVLVLLVAPGLRAVDRWLGWQSGLSPSGAQALYETVTTLTLTFLVFTFGSLLVAIQVAGGQLTPRVIATTLLRDNVVRYSVGIFVFTLMFAVMARNRIEDRVFELVETVTGLLGIACTATFLFLIDHAARLLRPVSIVGRVGNEGVTVIKSVYPTLVGDAPEAADDEASALGTARRVVPYAGDSGIILAVDVASLIAEARRFHGVVELIPQVGDFIAPDDALFALYDGAAAIPAHRLRHAVAMGSERTLEQDPMFAFRIVVDIALKALSPAINDPTTAVLAIDQIHRLLRLVGTRQLNDEVLRDAQGMPRLVLRTPNWEDFVDVACREIRSCGAGSVQVARRLRAMLDNVIASLPGHRRKALLEELRRLDRAIETAYPEADDLALARTPDTQGLGGSSRAATTMAR